MKQASEVNPYDLGDVSRIQNRYTFPEDAHAYIDARQLRARVAVLTKERNVLLAVCRKIADLAVAAVEMMENVQD